jgi:hypothetical protein
MRRFMLLIAGLSLAGPAAAQPTASVWADWQPRPPAIAAEEASRDPAGAARRAIAAGDWRPFGSITFGSRGTDGMDCAIPIHMLDFVTVVRSLPHRPDLPGSPPRVSLNLVPYNQALLAAPGSPLAGICVAGGVWLPVHGAPARPWGMIAPPPARPAASLLEAARWGRAAEAAAFPVDPSLPRDMFHMNALAWAVAHGDTALVRRIMAARPDNAAWCAPARLQGSGYPPGAISAVDPLNLAVAAGRADLVALIAPVFSQAACAVPHAYHLLYLEALRTALQRRDEAVVRALVAHYGAASHQQRGDLARDIEEAGLGRIAADYYHAAPELAYDNPLARTSEMCEIRTATFWAAESLRRGRREDLAYAWDRLQRHEVTPYPLREGVDCAALLDLYRSHGFTLAPESPLLHWAVIGDRHSLGRKASQADAERFLAAWRRLGGRLDSLADVHCPVDPLEDNRSFCTAGELARGTPRISIRLGETVFAELLPPDRPSRAERIVENARRSTRPPRALKPEECPVPLASPDVLVRTQACIDRNATPVLQR